MVDYYKPDVVSAGDFETTKNILLQVKEKIENISLEYWKIENIKNG